MNSNELMDQPLISICIPCYNSSKYIHDTLNSLIKQTYKSIEIIVVEDGSTEPCDEEIKKINDSRIRYFFKENGGAGSARNFAYKLATGDFIKFMDADDLLSEQAIEKQVELALLNPTAIISGKWGRFYKDDITTFKLAPEEVWKEMTAIDWIQTSWLRGANMTQPGIFLISRELIDRRGLWNEKLSQGPIDDMEFFTRIILGAKKVIFCSGSILMYRSGILNSLSTKKSEESMTVALETIKRSANHLTKIDNSPKSKDAITVQFQLFIYNVYPYYMDLYKEALLVQSGYGKSNLKFHAGGVTKILTTLLGWKLAKLVRSVFVR